MHALSASVKESRLRCGKHVLDPVLAEWQHVPQLGLERENNQNSVSPSEKKQTHHDGIPEPVAKGRLALHGHDEHVQHDLIGSDLQMLSHTGENIHTLRSADPLLVHPPQRIDDILAFVSALGV